MFKQRLCGLAFIVMSIIILVFAWHGTTLEESDITPVIFLLPFGLYCLLSKTNIMIEKTVEIKKHRPPPNHPNCRCSINPISEDEISDL